MPREQTLRHVRSDEFRLCFVDGASAALISDNIGDRLQLSFTRMDVIISGERVQILDDGRLQQIPGSMPESDQQKTVEFTVEMRPDIALQVINNLLMTLQNLPPQRKQTYGIPDSLPQLITPLPVGE